MNTHQVCCKVSAIMDVQRRRFSKRSMNINMCGRNVLPKFRSSSAVVSSDVEANSLVYSHESEDLLSLAMQEQQQPRTRSVKLGRIASHDSDEIFNERKSVDRIPTRVHSAALQACLRADLRATAPRSSTIPSQRKRLKM